MSIPAVIPTPSNRILSSAILRSSDVFPYRGHTAEHKYLAGTVCRCLVKIALLYISGQLKNVSPYVPRKLFPYKRQVMYSITLQPHPRSGRYKINWLPDLLPSNMFSRRLKLRPDVAVNDRRVKCASDKVGRSRIRRPSCDKVIIAIISDFPSLYE